MGDGHVRASAHSGGAGEEAGTAGAADEAEDDAAGSSFTDDDSEGSDSTDALDEADELLRSGNAAAAFALLSEILAEGDGDDPDALALRARAALALQDAAQALKVRRCTTCWLHVGQAPLFMRLRSHS